MGGAEDREGPAGVSWLPRGVDRGLRGWRVWCSRRRWQPACGQYVEKSASRRPWAVQSRQSRSRSRDPGLCSPGSGCGRRGVKRLTSAGTEGGWKKSARGCLGHDLAGRGRGLSEKAVEAVWEAVESRRGVLENGDGGSLIPTGQTFWMYMYV